MFMEAMVVGGPGASLATSSPHSLSVPTSVAVADVHMGTATLELLAAAFQLGCTGGMATSVAARGALIVVSSTTRSLIRIWPSSTSKRDYRRNMPCTFRNDIIFTVVVDFVSCILILD